MTVNTTQSQPSSSVQPYRPAILLVWSRRNALRLSLLVVISTGITYNTLTFRFVPWYVQMITLSGWFALMFIGLSGLRWLQRPVISRRRWSFIIIPTLMFLHQFVIHGIAFRALSDFEFRKAFVVFTVSLLTVIAGSVLWITPIHFRQLNRMTCLVAYAMGSVGLLQFVVSNALGQAWHVVPESLRQQLREDPVANDDRFGGLIRGTGMSIEPSYYGSGMAIIFGLCLTCIMLVPHRGFARWYQWGAVLIALVGVIISASGAAWVLVASALAAWVLAHIQWRGVLPSLQSRLSRIQRRTIRRIILLLVLAGTLTTILLVPFLASRFEKIQNGIDSSANSRVLLAIDLIRQPGDTFSESLFGTGLGREGRSQQLIEGYKRYGIYFLLLLTDSYPIWNGYAYYAVAMGYSGLLLYGALAMTAVLTRNQTGVPMAHLSVLVILYPMAHGINLLAPWFGFIVLVVVLKSVRRADEQGT